MAKMAVVGGIVGAALLSGQSATGQVDDGVTIAPVSIQQVHERARSEDVSATVSPVGVTQSADDFLSVWIIPRLIYDERDGSDVTTLWAVRNEDAEPVIVDVLYYDTFGNVATSESKTLAVRETWTRNVRDVPDLLDPFMVPAPEMIEGYILVSARRQSEPAPNDGKVSVDFFIVDSMNDYASGDRAVVFADRCRRWSARFLNFGTGPSSIDVVTEGLGDLLLDPPTARVTLFAEDGHLLDPFDVYTSKDAFTIDLTAHTPVNFGVAIVDFGPGRAGVVALRHSAFSKYTVGHLASCMDS